MRCEGGEVGGDHAAEVDLGLGGGTANSCQTKTPQSVAIMGEA